MMRGDIEGKKILDPGCGTGVLSCGAKLLGAEYVLGIDVDKRAVEVAEKNAEKLKVDAEFLVSDIKSFECRHFDTVVMNPPFGAQNVHADRPFIDMALECSDVVYSVFNKGSLGFVKSYVKKRAEVTAAFSCSFPMKKTFSHHTKECVYIDVEIVRMTKI
ncbi:putative methylase [Methanomicrobium sp. W14]|jgi:putative methylase|uniref:METTL5 family protein n=1 Tax=Methanomicrobium sp. W14 TaxID=2817839 RepID=UPI0032AFB81C|nr:putative methylase [Methanomicrobium sp. W14]